MLNELRSLLNLLAFRSAPGLYRATYVGSDDQIAAQLVVVEKIWSRVLGTAAVVDHGDEDPYADCRKLAIRCVTTIERGTEIRENLGDDAPTLSVEAIHPWIWEGARSLWQSRHFSEAVVSAARKLNAELQNKVARRDVSETDLFNQAFSDDTPTDHAPRLRMPDDDGGKTAKSVRRGMRTLAEGCFAAIRNPLAHDGVDLQEHEALELLAALSVLARRVDAADVITAH